ncbi:hypothetical protein ACFQWB_15930 [Paenibacillus thermoaerophilus]|uniref:Uncharacterized protein n=1 Tax=Paenibacillus thermoaerophilus TaxID=1215385 RepID=A0ABW2V5J2_9BACL|nr:hypothetical protein [Paenibacillus thermoaerophilus]TMV09474.1 hypothetical protein FE781_14455 [Paenibacillus thermoaerophilus]
MKKQSYYRHISTIAFLFYDTSHSHNSQRGEAAGESAFPGQKLSRSVAAAERQQLCEKDAGGFVFRLDKAMKMLENQDKHGLFEGFRHGKGTVDSTCKSCRKSSTNLVDYV